MRTNGQPRLLLAGLWRLLCYINMQAQALGRARCGLVDWCSVLCVVLLPLGVFLVCARRVSVCLLGSDSVDVGILAPSRAGAQHYSTCPARPPPLPHRIMAKV